MAVTDSSGDDSHSSPALHSIEEELLVRDFINKLEIANGLKQLLLSKAFMLKSLLNASTSDLAEILGIDEYIAKIMGAAMTRAVAKDTASDTSKEPILDPVLTSVTGAD